MSLPIFSGPERAEKGDVSTVLILLPLAVQCWHLGHELNMRTASPCFPEARVVPLSDPLGSEEQPSVQGSLPGLDGKGRNLQSLEKDRYNLRYLEYKTTFPKGILAGCLKPIQCKQHV